MSNTLARTWSSVTDSALLKKLVIAALIVAFGVLVMVVGDFIEGDSIAMRHNESMAIAFLTASI